MVFVWMVSGNNNFYQIYFLNKITKIIKIAESCIYVIQNQFLLMIFFSIRIKPDGFGPKINVESFVSNSFLSLSSFCFPPFASMIDEVSSP